MSYLVTISFSSMREKRDKKPVMIFLLVKLMGKQSRFNMICVKEKKRKNIDGKKRKRKLVKLEMNIKS